MARAALLLAVSFVVTTCAAWSASAGITHFINPNRGEPGHYDWRWQRLGEPGTLLNWLDVTMPSTGQGLGRNGNSVGQLFLGDENFHNNGSENGAMLAHIPGFRVTKALRLEDSVDNNLFRDSVWHAGDMDGISYFPVGEVRYMGVLTSSGNYGWIKVVRGAAGWHRFSFEALEWAYETIPGKGISAGEVPAPSGLALFTSLLFVRSSRRRNHASA